MNDLFSKLSFISICYNDSGIYKTTQSIEKLLKLGSKHIIQNGGESLDSKKFLYSQIHNESDTGIYNALNKAISKVETEYFILIHAGDTFIGCINDLREILLHLIDSKADLSLNNQIIGSRPHNSNFWYPWMLYLGAQPPHLPTVYRSGIFQNIRYSETIPIIADFHFFKSLNWQNYQKDNKLLIKMATGGKTSSGVKSFLDVNRKYLEVYGTKGWVYVILRVPMKILQIF